MAVEHEITTLSKAFYKNSLPQRFTNSQTFVSDEAPTAVVLVSNWSNELILINYFRDYVRGVGASEDEIHTEVCMKLLSFLLYLILSHSIH